MTPIAILCTLTCLNSPPASVDFRGLAAVDAKVCWVSGTSGTVCRTIDGGTTWDVFKLPHADKLDFRDIEAFDEKRAVALSAGPGEQSQIFKTVDGGKTWTHQFTNPIKEGFLDAIAFWDDKNGIVLGDPVDGRFQMLKTVDGQTWTVLEGPQAIENEGCFAASGTCLIATGTQDAWFVTGGAKTSRVFHSADRGKTWQVSDLPIKAGIASRGAFGIHFKDAKSGMIVGGDYKTPDDKTATAAMTTDGGKTWKVIDGQLPYRSAITWTGRTWLAVGPTGTSHFTDAQWKTIDTTRLNSAAFGKDGGWATGPNGMVRKLSR